MRASAAFGRSIVLVRVQGRKLGSPFPPRSPKRLDQSPATRPPPQRKKEFLRERAGPAAFHHGRSRCYLARDAQVLARRSMMLIGRLSFGANKVSSCPALLRLIGGGPTITGNAPIERRPRALSCLSSLRRAPFPAVPISLRNMARRSSFSRHVRRRRTRPRDGRSACGGS